MENRGCEQVEVERSEAARDEHKGERDPVRHPLETSWRPAPGRGRASIIGHGALLDEHARVVVVELSQGVDAVAHDVLPARSGWREAPDGLSSGEAEPQDPGGPKNCSLRLSTSMSAWRAITSNTRQSPVSHENRSTLW